MLKKERRLSTNFEFNTTRKYGQKLSGQLCYLYYLKQKDLSALTRTGIVVSTKIHKSAVKRNRIKRLFSDCLRAKFDTIPDGMWVVIHPTTKSLEASHEEICTELDSLLSKISVS